MTQRTKGATIRFDATLTAVGTSTVLRLPQTASNHLPSRGQVAVRGTSLPISDGPVARLLRPVA